MQVLPGPALSPTMGALEPLATANGLCPSPADQASRGRGGGAPSVPAQALRGSRFVWQRKREAGRGEGVSRRRSHCPERGRGAQSGGGGAGAPGRLGRGSGHREGAQKPEMSTWTSPLLLPAQRRGPETAGSRRPEEGSGSTRGRGRGLRKGSGSCFSRSSAGSCSSPA